MLVCLHMKKWADDKLELIILIFIMYLVVIWYKGSTIWDVRHSTSSIYLFHSSALVYLSKANSFENLVPSSVQSSKVKNFMSRSSLWSQHGYSLPLLWQGCSRFSSRVRSTSTWFLPFIIVSTIIYLSTFSCKSIHLYQVYFINDQVSFLSLMKAWIKVDSGMFSTYYAS